MALRNKLIVIADSKFKGEPRIIKSYNKYLAVIMTKDKEEKWVHSHFQDPYDLKGHSKLSEYLKSKNLDEYWKPLKVDRERNYATETNVERVTDSEVESAMDL